MINFGQGSRNQKKNEKKESEKKKIILRIHIKR